MKYAIPKCPECGEVLQGECDYTPGCAEVEEVEPGVFEYTGSTDMFWDGQVNERDLERVIKGEKQDTLSRVQCHNGHQWDTEVRYN